MKLECDEKGFDEIIEDLAQGKADNIEEKPAKREPSANIEIERLKKLLAQEVIKNELILAGVQKEKIPKALRLFDAESISVEGIIDRQALALEIEEILEDFPELLTAVSRNETFGFKFGADNQQGKKNNQKIASVFGNIQ